ncbi:MAG: alpha-L-arabinofuranosidase C-terminal domain-containing protein, partial [Planctomycetota bacterium]
EPISKYIYGQFIEHLGRCIYGGIWAEMLEDRKFYFPVTDDYEPYSTTDKDKNVGYFPILTGSPWRVVGPAGSVKMVSENSYVGEHTPEIQLAGDGTGRGIEQPALELIKGKEYVGRIVIAGSPQAAPIKVSLKWRKGKKGRQTVIIDKINDEFTKVPLHFKANATTKNARLRIVGKGKGTFKIGTVSLMPADNVNGMRPDTLKLIKQLNSPIYRWPGGNFVSGYDWKDGIGDPDKRPPRKNPAWTGIEHNDFGVHEFIRFCRQINTEPYIAVNSGLGGVRSAAELVEYANGAVDTPLGRLRSQNGHPAPFRVKWWGIGNEMYGDWQLGHMPLGDYVKKHNEFADAMRAVDRSTQLVAVGSVGDWSKQTLTTCADHMELISEHFYCGHESKSPTWRTAELPLDSLKQRPQAEQAAKLLTHVSDAPRSVARIVDAHRAYRTELDSLKGKDIRIAIDEYNYWYGPHLYGELGTRYYLQDALGIAAALHEMTRNSDIVFMANYAQTVNVIGCIKTTKTRAAFDTTGLVLKLYRSQFGTIPVKVTSKAGPLDIAAAWTKNQKALTIAIVNPTKTTYDLALDLKGATMAGSGRQFQIAGPDPMAYNEPGKKPNVVIEKSNLVGITNKVTVPPLSITLCRLPTVSLP